MLTVQVLGELCVGIFARRDVAAGEELTYSYNLEWNGGRRVRSNGVSLVMIDRPRSAAWAQMQKFWSRIGQRLSSCSCEWRPLHPWRPCSLDTGFLW